jgi:GNAT superfamily N-acetyltransferase
MTVRIRPYSSADYAAVKNLIDVATMSTVNRFFVKTLTRDIIAQSMLMLAASIFILIGLPLQYSLIALPTTAVIVYACVWTAHKVKARHTHGDLDHIEAVYQSTDKTGFWVAEDSTSREIVGTVAVCVKGDPDMREPPQSVAFIRRMAVSTLHQRRGIGKSLADVAIAHCQRQDFSAVELITSECHAEARQLYLKKGFEIVSCYDKGYAFGAISINMYRFRLSCRGASEATS